MNLKPVIKKIVKKLLYLKDEVVWWKHINRVYRHLGVKNSAVDHELVIKHQQYWGQLKKRVNPKWLKVYCHITGNHDIRYIPENIYFSLIEEKLNDRKLALAYGDKNFYELFYNQTEIFPETILRNINGLFYSKEYKLLDINEKSLKQFLQKYQKLLIKPSVDSGGGRKIQLFQGENDRFVNNENQNLTLEYLKQHFGTNYIIQNYIQQSEYLSQFNSSSVNTIRVFTYRSVVTDEIIPLHAVLRIGKKGNFIDDQNVGGVACRLNDGTGLNDYATNYFGEKFFNFNGITFSDIKEIPKVKEMKEIAIIFAKRNIYSRVMGFDFTLDISENIKLIEINHLWTGINFFQMNGASVFGKYTDEVVHFCKNN